MNLPKVCPAPSPETSLMLLSDAAFVAFVEEALASAGQSPQTDEERTLEEQRKERVHNRLWEQLKTHSALR